METIDKLVTKRNLWILEVITGLLALSLVYILYRYVKDMDFSILESLPVVFYIAMFCTIISSVASGYLCFYKKQKDKQILVIFIMSLIFTIGCFFLYPFMKAMNQTMNPNDLNDWYGGFQSSYQLNNDTQSTGKIGFFMVAGLLQIIFSIYSAVQIIIHKKQTIEPNGDIYRSNDKGKQSFNAGNMDAGRGEHLNTNNPDSSSFKRYYQTKSGKKVTIIICSLIALLIVIFGGYQVYSSTRKTKIDVFKECEIKYEGYSGKGEAQIECNTDYEGNDENVYHFISNVRYEIVNNGSLKNDDKVKVKAIYDENEANTLKIKLKNLEKEFSVKGLTVVYEKAKEIPNELYEDAKTIAEGFFEQYYLENEDSFTRHAFNDRNSNDLSNVTLSDRELVASFFRNDYETSTIYFLFSVKLNATKDDSPYTRNAYILVTYSPFNNKFVGDGNKRGNAKVLNWQNIDEYSDSSKSVIKYIMDSYAKSAELIKEYKVLEESINIKDEE